MRRTVVRALGALLGCGTALLALPAGSASAHAALVSSVPAANSVLEAGPPAVSLTFDEAVEVSLASIQLFDQKGAALKLGPVQAGAGSATVTATVPALTNGVYAVLWRVTSADGHVVSGAFSFQIGTDAATGSGSRLIERIGGGIRAAPAVAWWYGVARFLSLAGAILLIGAGLWSLQGRPPLGSSPVVRRLVRAGPVALLLGSLGAFGMFGAQSVAGSAASALKPSVWSTVADSDTGRMLLLRSALAVVLGVLLVLSRTSSRLWWWRVTAAVAAMATLVTFSASGHPNALSPSALWIAVDAVHVAGIVVWVGGLVALGFAGRQWLSEPEAVRPVHRFSMTATLAVPVVVGTGVAQTWKLAGGLSDVTATTWGRILLTKGAVVVALLAVAGVSRWLLQHEGAGSIRRTVLVEAAMGIAVVALAAGMVAQPPRPAVPSLPYSQQLTASGVIAGVTITPGHVGSNEVHIILTPPGGSLAPIADVSARVLLPSAGIPESPVTLSKLGPNHYTGSVTFPRPGAWTLQLIVQVNATDTALITSTVTIP